MNLCDWNDFHKNLEKIKKSISENKKIIEPCPMLSLIDEPLIQRKNAFIFAFLPLQNLKQFPDEDQRRSCT